MEEGLKEYLFNLSENFWQVEHNPKIKFEFGYEENVNIAHYDWFTNGMHRQFQPEQFDLELCAKFYRFYSFLVESEPEIIDFLSTVPLSYHRILIQNCEDAYEALSIISKALENDWSRLKLINYFKMNRN